MRSDLKSLLWKISISECSECLIETLIETLIDPLLVTLYLSVSSRRTPHLPLELERRPLRPHEIGTANRPASSLRTSCLRTGGTPRCRYRPCRHRRSTRRRPLSGDLSNPASCPSAEDRRRPPGTATVWPADHANAPSCADLFGRLGDNRLILVGSICLAYRGGRFVRETWTNRSY